MLMTKVRIESVVVFSALLAGSLSLFNPALAQGSQVNTPTVKSSTKCKTATNSKTGTKIKTEKTSAIPAFKRRKGKLSAEEVKIAGEDANKFYRLAEQREKAGKLDEAKDFYYKCAVIRSDVWGQDNSAVANIGVKIGEIEVRQNHPKEARTWFKQAIAALSKRYGSGDYELVPILTEMAKLESAEKNHEAAASYYDHILRLEERKFGEESMQAVPIRITYIEELLADKDNREAEKVANKGIEIEQKTRAAGSQDLAKFQQLLSTAKAARASNGGK